MLVLVQRIYTKEYLVYYFYIKGNCRRRNSGVGINSQSMMKKQEDRIRWIVRGVTLAAVLAWAGYSAFGMFFEYRREKAWTDLYAVTTICRNHDAAHFYKALSIAGDHALENPQQVLLEITDNCNFKDPAQSPLLTAFDKGFAALPMEIQGHVFQQMKDPSQFFGKRILTSYDGWKEPSAEDIRKTRASLIRVSESRRNLLSTIHGSKLQQLLLEEIKQFASALNEARKVRSDIDQFSRDVSLMQDHLQSITALRAVLNSGDPDSALTEATEALSTASRELGALAGSDAQQYRRENVILGQSVPVGGASGVYMLGIRTSGPERALFHFSEGASVNPGMYDLYVRTAHLNELIQPSAPGAWISTYEVADEATSRELRNLQRSSSQLMTAAASLFEKLQAQAAPLKERLAAVLLDLPANGDPDGEAQLINIISHPKTIADWQYLAELDDDWAARDCGDATFCYARQAQITRGLQALKQTGATPPSGVRLEYKLLRQEKGKLSSTHLRVDELEASCLGPAHRERPHRVMAQTNLFARLSPSATISQTQIDISQSSSKKYNKRSICKQVDERYDLCLDSNLPYPNRQAQNNSTNSNRGKQWKV